MRHSASGTLFAKKGWINRLIATSGILALGVALFGVHPAFAAKSGFVSNTSGGQNFVDVSNNGQITITPVKKSDGTYTTDLNSGALKDFLMTESVFACLNPPPPPPNNGGGNNGGYTYSVYKDNGDGTHSRTDVTVDSHGNVDSTRIGNSGPNSNFFDHSGWSN